MPLSFRAVFRAAPAILTALLISVLIPAVSRAEVIDRIVAIINDSVITLSELNAATALTLEKVGGDKQDGKIIFEMKNKILENLIEQKIVKQASDRAGIDISEREIDNAVDDIKKENNLSQEALMLSLAQSGLTNKQYREQLKEQIRQVKFINKEFRSKISIQSEDVEDYYRQHVDEFKIPAAYRINMIFVPAADKAARAEKMKEIEDGLSKGADFKEVARQYSEGPSAANGGDMGYLKANEMDKSIQDAVVKLKTGEISPAISTAEGVYMIQLVDTKPSEQRPLEEVKGLVQDKIYKKVMDERFNFWLNEVKKYAHIEVRL